MQMHIAKIVLLFALTASFVASSAARADNWPRWRGAEGIGYSAEKNVPTKWSSDTGENIRWKTPLTGPGMSSPIVWGQRIFLTQALDKQGTQRAILCFDRKDGKKLWQTAVEFKGKESTYEGEPHYCSATPATDGERVVASFGSAGVLCCDVNGKDLWRRDLGPCEQIWGNASSPILYRDLVILNFGPGERTFLVALDKKTGKDVWRVPIAGGSFGTDPKMWTGSWSTPVIARAPDGDELIMTWPDAVTAYNPATGKQRWTCKGLTKLVYTSPLVTSDSVVAMSGFGGSYMAVRRGGSGDVSDTHLLWQAPKATQRIGSGAIVGDHAYIINENGTAECIDRKSGKTLWLERVGGRFWSSLVHVDGRLYATNQQGETVVLAAKPVFEVLNRNSLGERTQASIAVSNGELFIRTYERLWCIGAPDKSASAK